MRKFELELTIDATVERVWRALTDPGEVIVWDTGVLEALDAPADYPQPGQHVRWRYRNGAFRTLHDRPVEVVAQRTLRSLLSVGPFRFDETYTLEQGTGGGTALSVAMIMRVPIPVVSLLLEPWLERETRRTVGASMAVLKQHCEEPREAPR